MRRLWSQVLTCPRGVKDGLEGVASGYCGIMEVALAGNKTDATSFFMIVFYMCEVVYTYPLAFVVVVCGNLDGLMDGGERSMCTQSTSGVHEEACSCTPR